MPSTSLRRRLVPVAAVTVAAALAVGGLAGCGDDGTAVSSATTAAPGTTTPVDVGIVAVGAWARSSPMEAGAGAAYMTVENTTGVDDEIVGVSVPASVAATAELHRTSMGEGGMMSMAPVASIPVPAGGRVALEPGGYHVMLLDLATPLTVGADVPITLTFAGSAPVEVVAVVRAS